MTVWPSSLPAPLLSTFKETPPDNVIRTSMDVGVAKVRKRTSANVRPISFSLMLTPAQVDEPAYWIEFDGYNESMFPNWGQIL